MANISLMGFDSLDSSEIASIQDIVAKNLKKIKVTYQLVKIELKSHKHATRFSHEIKADLFLNTGKAFSSSFSHDNLYKALDCVMEKLISEINHKIKK